MNGERSEGVLDMAADTTEFPVTAMSINGAFRAQFIKTTVLDSNHKSKTSCADPFGPVLFGDMFNLK